MIACDLCGNPAAITVWVYVVNSDEADGFQDVYALCGRHAGAFYDGMATATLKRTLLFTPARKEEAEKE